MTGDTRLPAHLEIGAIVKLAQAQGGMASVLAKGERDAGTILLVTISRGVGGQLYERMPQLDGSRLFVLTKSQDIENPNEFSEYLDRRRAQDSDIWVLEVDIDDPGQFIADLPV